jgi:hypothetical protein
MQHDSTIPADLLELKGRFDVWRANRRYKRETTPEELRRAALEMSRRYPPALMGRVLKLDPSRLKKPVAKPLQCGVTRKKPCTAFFQLPTEVTLPAAESSSFSTPGCRLQLERPDGSRLTLTLSALDLTSINRLCADFLRA